MGYFFHYHLYICIAYPYEWNYPYCTYRNDIVSLINFDPQFQNSSKFGTSIAGIHPLIWMVFMSIILVFHYATCYDVAIGIY